FSIRNADAGAWRTSRTRTARSASCRSPSRRCADLSARVSTCALRPSTPEVPPATFLLPHIVQRLQRGGVAHCLGAHEWRNRGDVASSCRRPSLVPAFRVQRARHGSECEVGPFEGLRSLFGDDAPAFGFGP